MVKKAKVKKAKAGSKAKKGSKLVCDTCGMVVKVENPCDCDPCGITCCGDEMQPMGCC